MMHLSDIKVPAGVEITQLQHGEEHDHAIVSVLLMKAESVEEQPPEEAAVPAVAQQPDEKPGQD
jgi:large subunit ribosomal protein L25